MVGSAGSAVAEDLWKPEVRAVIGADHNGARSGVEGFAPLVQSPDSVLFLDLRVNHDFRKDRSIEAGLGVRRIVNPDLMVGAYGFLSLRDFGGKRFGGATVGVEAIGSQFDAHANLHIPFTRERDSSSASSSLSFVANRLVEQVSVLNRRDFSMWGIEGEFGVQAPVDLPDGHGLRLHVGGYHFWDPGNAARRVTGGKAGFEYSISDIFNNGVGASLSLGGEVRHDNRHGTNFVGTVRLSVPLGRPEAQGDAEDDGSEPVSVASEALRKRVNERVRGDIGLRIETDTSSSSLTRNAVNPATNAEYGLFFFADGGNTLGLGTIGDPTTLDDAIADAGPNGFIVALGGSGNLTTPGATLLQGQTLIGGGQSIPVALFGGGTTSFSLGGTDGTIQGTNPAANVIALANNTTVQGVTITGGASGLFGNNVANVLLSNVTVSGAGANGAAFAGASSVAGQNFTATGNGGSGLQITGDGTYNFLGITTLSGNTVDGLNVNGNGSYSFATLNALNNLDDGIDVTSVSGRFSTTGGAIAGNGDQAVKIDPVAVNVVLDSISHSGGSTAILLDDISGSFRVTGATTISGTAGSGIIVSNSSASVSFDGGATITNSGGDGISLTGNSGTVTFLGTTTITNPGAGAAAVDIEGNNGAISFSSLQIGLQTAGSIGLDLTAATVNSTVTATDFDLTSTTAVNTVGVRLVDAAGIGTVRLGDTAVLGASATIGATGTAPATGVLVSAATSLNFIFGDGEAAIDVGSTINAVTPIAATDTLPFGGTYNFLDATLVGDTSNLSTTLDIYYVDIFNDGVNDGSRTNPGTIAGAMADLNADVIVLVDRTGADVIDTNDAFQGSLPSLLLKANQRLMSFKNGDTLNIGGGAPANFLLTGINAGFITNPFAGTGAPTLTSTGAGSTVVLGGNNLIQGVDITSGAAFHSISGTAVATATVRGSAVGTALLTGMTGTVTLDNTTLSRLEVAGSSVAIVGTGASFTNAAAFATIAVSGGHTGSMGFDAASTINATNGSGLQFDNADGSYTFNGTTTLNGGDAGIDILNGSAGTFIFAAGTTVTSPTGTAFNVNASSATVTYNGTITQNNAASAVVVSNNTGGSVAFGGNVAASTSTATAVLLTNNVGAVSFNNGLQISTTTGTGLRADTAGTVNIAATGGGETVTSSAGQAVQLDNITVGIALDSVSSTGGANGISLLTVGGSFAVSGTTTVATSTGAGISIVQSTATVTFGGPTTVTNSSGIGILLQDSTGAATFNGTTTLTNPAAGMSGLAIKGTNGAVTINKLVVALQTSGTTGLDASSATLGGNVRITDFDLTSTTATNTVGIDVSNVTSPTNQVLVVGDTANPAGGQSATIAGVHTGVLFSSFTNIGFTFGDGEAGSDVASTIDATIPIRASDTLPMVGSYNFLDVTLTGDTTNLQTNLDIYYVDNVTNGDGSRANPGSITSAMASLNADVIVLLDRTGADTITVGAGSLLLDASQRLMSFRNGNTINVGGGAPPSFLLTGITGGEITNPFAGTSTAPILTANAGFNVVTLANSNLIEGVIITSAAADFSVFSAASGGIIRGSAVGGVQFTAAATGTVTIDNTTLSHLSVLGGNVNISATGTTAVNNGAAVAAVSISGGHTGTIGFATTTTMAVTAGTGLQFDDADGTYNFLGNNTLTNTFAGIKIADGSAGSFTFGSATTATSITNTTGLAFNLVNNTATVTYNGNITQTANATALVTVANHSVGTVIFQNGTLNATLGTGLQFGNADGTYQFLGTTTLNGGNAGIDIITASAGTFTFGNAGSTTTTITNPTGVAFNLANSTATVTFNGGIGQTANNAALVSIVDHSVGTIIFQNGTLNASTGSGLQFDNADGTYQFNGTTTIGGTATAGVNIVNGSAGGFTFGTGAAITSPAGIAFRADGSAANVTYNGTITQNNAFGAVSVSNNTGGTITFNGLVTASTSTATAVNFSTNTSTLEFRNGLNVNTTTGTGLLAQNGGTVTITATSGTEDIVSTAGTALSLNNIAANIVLDDVSGSGGNAISLSLLTGSLGVTGTTTASSTTGAGIIVTQSSATFSFNDTTVTNAGGDGIFLSLNTGSVSFLGTTTVTNPGTAIATSAAVDIDSTNGAINFNNLQITLGTANTIGLDLNGATLNGNIIAGDFDVDGGGPGVASTLGIDLSGTTGTGTFFVRLGDTTNNNPGPAGQTSRIFNVAQGVLFSAATDLGETGAGAFDGFIFGDGATPAESIITTTGGLVLAGTLPVNGSYNFFDAVLTGDTSNLSSALSIYYVDDVNEGANDGSASSPGTILDAIASLRNVIVLVNDTDDPDGIIDIALQGGTTLTLLNNQRLYSFAGGNTINIGGGAPPNFKLTGVSTGTITNPGSGTPTLTLTLTLTTSVAANTITLNNNNIIQGVIATSGPGGFAVTGTGFAGPTITDSNLGGLSLTTMSGAVVFTNSTFTHWAISGGTIGITATDVQIASTTGTHAAFAVSGGHSGAINFSDTLSTISQTGAATAVSIVNKTTGNVTFGGLVSGSTSTAAGVTLTGNTGNTIAFNNGLDITTTTGTGFTATGGGTINLAATGENERVSSSAGQAIILDGVTVTMTLDSVAAGGGGVGISANNVGGTFTVSGTTTVNDVTDAGILIQNSAVNATFTGLVTVLNDAGGANGDGARLLTNTGTYDFNGGVNITVNGAGAFGFRAQSSNVVNILDPGGTNQITSNDGTGLLINPTTVNITLASLTSGGGVNGISLTSMSGSLTIGTVTINGQSGDGIDILNSAGTVTINGGSIGNTNDPAGIAVDVEGGTGNVTINASVAKTTASDLIEVTGRTTGTVSFGGALSATLQAGGIDVNGNSGGTIAFTNASKVINTSATASTAVSLVNNTGATITFSGGGLDVDTSSGIGIDATGGGSIAITGAGNSVQTTTGQILRWDGISIAAGNVTFATLGSSGTVAADAMSFTNVDGATFNGGAVTIAGTSGAGNSGITVIAGSAATFNFTSATIDNVAGHGINLNGANGAVTFDTVDIDTVGDTGVYINGNTSAVTISGGSIGATNDPGGPGVEIAAGTANVTIAASIAKTTAGNIVKVTGRTAGTIDFSGSLSATGGVANGIDVNGNSGTAVITFSGSTKTLNTGANTAISLANNTGATVNFTNGGLNVDTTSGTGLSIVGGGTVNISSASNAIDTQTGTAFLNTGDATVTSNAALTTTGAGRVVDIQARTAGTVSLSGNISNTGVGATGILVDSVTGGSVTFSGTSKALTTGGVAAVTLSGNAGGTVSFTNGGLVIGTGAGAGFTATGGGTLVVSGVGNTISTSTGTALNLNGVTVGAGGVTFGSLSTNGAANGILIDTVGQAAGSTGIDILGGSIVNASTRGVDINATGADVSIANLISTTATGRSVEVTNSGSAAVGGNQIVFSGAIDDNGLGINLDNNDASNGATITFSGGLAIDSTTNTGFNAINGGTVIVTGSANTINTSTGIALNVANTMIGAAGLTFQSISANGAASGIVLNNTGLAAGNGGLTITGDAGSTLNNSGGTIQNTSGPGISLASTKAINFDQIRVQSSGDDGIRGSIVAGFTLSNSNILSNGNAVGERGIEMLQLSGSGGISNTTVSGSAERHLLIENDTANLTAFNITGSTFSTTNMTTGDDGVLVLNTGSAAMTVSITGSTFTDNRGDHFQAATDADANGTMNITFNNNTLTTTAGNDPNVLGGGITINTSGSLDIVFQVNNNNIQEAFSSAVNVNLDPGSLAGASMNGTITGNTIGTAGIAGSGSESARTITVAAKGQGAIDIDILNNIVNEWGNEYGIFVGISEGAGASMVAKITGNTLNIANPNAVFNINGIRVDAGATAGDAGQLEAVITNNDFAGTGNAGNSDADIRLRQRFNTTIKLPGYGGANNDTAAVNTFVAGNNIGAPTVSSAHNVGGGGGGFIGGAVTPLMATPGGVAAEGEDLWGDVLSGETLDRLIAAAIDRWAALGITDEQLARLNATSFEIADLGGSYLGQADGDRVRIDDDGNGAGWYVDATPLTDHEFANRAGDTQLVADASQAPAGQYDLLTTIMHEFGHVLGYGDTYATDQSQTLMYGWLTTGERRLPNAVYTPASGQFADAAPN